MVNNVSDNDRLDRLILNEPAQEIAVPLEEFNREWVTLKDCTTIFGVQTKKAVYDIIRREGLISKVFMVGRKPVRHVDRNSINEYLGKQKSDTNVVQVSDKNADVTNKLLTHELGNMLVSVRDLPNQVKDLTQAIKDVNTQMANIIDKVVNQGIDLKEKWLQDRERRAEIEQRKTEAEQQERERRAKIDHKQLELQEKQLAAQERLITKVTEKKPMPVMSLVIVIILIGSILYLGVDFYNKQTQAKDKVILDMRSTVSAIEIKHRAEIGVKNEEIANLKEEKE